MTSTQLIKDTVFQGLRLGLHSLLFHLRGKDQYLQLASPEDRAAEYQEIIGTLDGITGTLLMLDTLGLQDAVAAEIKALGEFLDLMLEYKNDVEVYHALSADTELKEMMRTVRAPTSDKD